MTFYCRHRKVRDRSVFKRIEYFNFIHQSAETGTKYDSNFRREISFLPDIRSGLFDFVEHNLIQGCQKILCHFDERSPAREYKISEVRGWFLQVRDCATAWHPSPW